MSAPPEERLLWLKRAEDEKWSSRQLQQAIVGDAEDPDEERPAVDEEPAFVEGEEEAGSSSASALGATWAISRR